MALILCPECGGKVSDKARACIHCGYPLAEEIPEQYCPYCGKPNSLESAFCGYCGKSFVEAETTANEIVASSPSGPMDINAYAMVIPSRTDTALSQVAVAQPSYVEEQARCPKCGSTSLVGDRKGFGYGKAAVGAVIAGPVGLLAGGIGSGKTVVTCLNCGNKYQI